MNIRLTLTTALAVILASLSVSPLIQGWGWFFGGVGAVLVVTAAGLLTRLAPVPATVAACLLAVIACLPLMAVPAWYARAGAALIVVAGAAGLTRHRRLAALAWLITYLGALLIYLNASFAAGWSIAGFLPTRASIRHLASLASGGLDERAFVPPVPGIHGIVLVTAAGVGLMAVAADLLAIRLRSPAIAGLPLLALFSVPITTNAKQDALGSTVVFCLGIIGYLAMLAADGRDRLRIWGRLVTVWQYRDTEAVQGPDTRALAASGRRIGLAAVSIAVLVPLLIPGIGVHGLFGSHDNTGNGGKARVALPDPIVQMQHQLQSSSPQTVLTYTTTAANASSQYLHVYVLNYDGASGRWTLVTPGTSTQVGSKALRPAPGATAQIHEQVTRTRAKLARNVAGYNSKLSFLPVPYAPSSVGVSGEWAEDNSTLMVYSTKTALGGLDYTVTSKAVAPSQQQLEAAGSASSSPAATDYFEQPRSHARQLTKIADSITKGKNTAIDKAIALQDWFRTSSRFSYNLDVHLPDSTAGLVKFLTKTRQGYCQQFAFAMAILAREIGIPSRIVVGYTAGTNEGNNTWRITTADAHAWPELYFPAAGWLRFEPTPSGAEGQATADPPAYAGATAPSAPTGPQTGPAGGPGSALGTAGGKASSGALAKLRNLENQTDTLTGSGKRAGSAGTSFPYGWVILAVLVLALVTPGTARLLIRRARWHRAAGDAALASAAWRELRDDLADHAMAGRPSESPRGVAYRIGKLLGLETDAARALERVATAEERARYAPVPLHAVALRQDVAAVRRAIASEADAPVRWRARLLPSSTLGPARTALQNALDVFGWMEAAGLRLRNSALARRARLNRDPASARQVLG
ncbi:MAG TPA: DUF3488 and transglutaminase-like domain-containing protein [Streptosporangiaceae bacterium]|jgi:transglutaminase-like putative cysteine protease